MTPKLANVLKGCRKRMRCYAMNPPRRYTTTAFWLRKPETSDTRQRAMCDRKCDRFYFRAPFASASTLSFACANTRTHVYTYSQALERREANARKTWNDRNFYNSESAAKQANASLINQMRAQGHFKSPSASSTPASKRQKTTTTRLEN